MYRAPDQTPRCTLCGAAELTPPTYFTNTEGQPLVFFEERDAKPGLFGGTPRWPFYVNRAYVCLACGHVMPCLSDEELERLRARFGALQPVEKG